VGFSAIGVSGVSLGVGRREDEGTARDHSEGSTRRPGNGLGFLSLGGWALSSNGQGTINSGTCFKLAH
jgi:hypothetical protein